MWKKNKLTVNIGKSKIMIFKRGGGGRTKKDKNRNIINRKYI